MITAKDIHKKKFEKIKFGYSPEEVDAFLAQVEADLRLMEQELADANNKIQLLADKVREYKAGEDDLKNALIGAQRQAREVLDEAKAAAEKIEADAKADAETLHARAMEEQEEQLRRNAQQLAQENRTLVATQRQVAAFKKSLFDLYKEHLEQISRLPETIDELPADDAASEADMPAADVPDDTQAAAATDAATDATAEDSATGEQKRDPFQTSEFSAKTVRGEFDSRYGDLQFGSRRDDSRRDDTRRDDKRRR